MEFNFPSAQYILDTLVGSLVTLRGKNVLPQGQNYEPLRKKTVENGESHRFHLLENPSCNGNARDERRNRQVFPRSGQIIEDMAGRLP